MKALELGRRFRSLRFCLTCLLAMLVTGSVAAQADDRRADGRHLLIPGPTLAGAWITAQPGPLNTSPPKPEFNGFLRWLSPTLVAARGNLAYVVDDGRSRIFLYDIAQQSMTPIVDYSAGAVSAVAVAPDMSLFVADIHARQVLHYSADGRILRKFGNDLEMTRPVALLLDESNGEIMVADSSHNHVVVFNSLGRVLSVLKSRVTHSIDAMARGPDGLYLVDRLNQQIVVIGQDGTHRYILGKGTLKSPGAIAVDRFNRVFVSDGFNDRINIYENGELAASVGGTGASPAKFNRITSLWLEHNVLYVADSLNARIQTFRVAPPGVKERPND